ncbi:uncharacterized protein LOC106083979 [Stomoxys calcitrans]|uniref:uncharacterized protein LOC106083979 n=1 Tax=Stomoxys calcitrans TaxID=35570 RepID=UPI0027E354FD|nr:uncharacterized protein LOC106083979 [Stomoxys calcitrans]
MSSHQTSSTTKLNRKCQFTTTLILLAVLWTMLFTGAMARPSLDALLAKQNDVSQLFLDDLLASGNGDKIFHGLKRHHSNAKQPNYLAKWPGLRDLVLTIDYDGDDDTASPMETAEFLERLHQLAGNPPYDLFDDIRDNSEDDGLDMGNNSAKVLKSPNNQLNFKEHNTKKNVQYMSPCHFKICNMGRKRNARLLGTNY